MCNGLQNHGDNGSLLQALAEKVRFRRGTIGLNLTVFEIGENVRAGCDN